MITLDTFIDVFPKWILGDIIAINHLDVERKVCCVFVHHGVECVGLD